jgi:hypothetical protein
MESRSGNAIAPEVALTHTKTRTLKVERRLFDDTNVITPDIGRNNGRLNFGGLPGRYC